MSSAASSFGIALIATITVKEGKGDEFIKLISKVRANAEGSGEPDCTSYRPVRSNEDKNKFIIFERYTSEAALDHHRNQQPFQDLKNSGIIAKMELVKGEEIPGAES